MKKHFQKIRNIIPPQVAPILVIVFSLSMLIGGVYYVFAFGTGTAPNVTPSDPWTSNVNLGVSANEVLTAAKWNGLVNQVARGGGSLDCTTISSAYAYGGASASCNATYPNAVSGGCQSTCAPLHSNYLSGNTQNCSVITATGDLCYTVEAKQVRAHVTCCRPGGSSATPISCNFSGSQSFVYTPSTPCTGNCCSGGQYCVGACYRTGGNTYTITCSGGVVTNISFTVGSSSCSCSGHCEHDGH